MAEPGCLCSKRATIAKALRRDAGARQTRILTCAAGRSARVCSARTARESRRCRASSPGMSVATAATISYEGRALDAEIAARGARRRHRDGDAGDQPRARSLGRGEHLPARARPAGPPVARGDAAARRRDPRRSRPGRARCRSTAEVRDLSAAQRQLVEIAKALGAQSQSHHLRRADRLAEPERGRAPVRRDRAARRRRAARSCSSRIGSRRCSRSPKRSRSCARAARSRPRVDRRARSIRPSSIRLMVGRDLGAIYTASAAPRRRVARDPILSVRGLSSPPLVRDVSFDLHRGEILGLGGLVGAGRSETLETMFGLRAARRRRGPARGQAVRAANAGARRSARASGSSPRTAAARASCPISRCAKICCSAHLGAHRGFGLGYGTRLTARIASCMATSRAAARSARRRRTS